MNFILILFIILAATIIFLINEHKKNVEKKLIEEKDNLKKELEYKINYLEGRISAISVNTLDVNKVVAKEVHEKALQEKNAELKYVMNEYKTLATSLDDLKLKYDTELSKKRSEQVRLGLISEKLIPFLTDFNHNPKNLAALFHPIDFIAFDEEEIVFIEIKSGAAKLSDKQQKIKEHVENKRVRFEIHRLNEKGYEIK